jgi:hypothetical protein
VKRLWGPRGRPECEAQVVSFQRAQARHCSPSFRIALHRLNSLAFSEYAICHAVSVLSLCETATRLEPPSP